MTSGSNYENPFADFANENEVFCANLATDCLIESVSKFLPTDKRDDCVSEEGKAQVRDYVTEKMFERNYLPRIRTMMYHHIIDWHLANGLDPDKPKHTSFLDRFMDAIEPERASSRARRERWHYADQLLTQVLSIRAHVIAGILRKSHDILPT